MCISVLNFFLIYHADFININTILLISVHGNTKFSRGLDKYTGIYIYVYTKINTARYKYMRVFPY